MNTKTKMNLISMWMTFYAYNDWELAEDFIKHFITGLPSTAEVKGKVVVTLEIVDESKQKLTRDEYLKQVKESQTNIPDLTSGYDLGKIGGRRKK